MAEYNFDNLISQFTKIDTLVKSLTTSMATLDKDGILKMIGSTKLLNEENKKLSTIQKDQIKVEKDIQKEKDKQFKSLMKLSQQKEKALLAESKIQRQQIAEAKELEALNKKQVKSEADLIRQTNLLVKKRKELVVITKADAVEHKKLTAQINSNTDALKKSDKQIGRFQRNVGNYGTALKGFFTKLGLVVGITAIINVVKESVKLAGAAEGVKAAFNNLNQAGLLDDLRKATQGTVSDLKLMQNAVKAKNFKIPLNQLATYFEFATKRAAQTGESVDYLVDSIINGIGRKSALVLDNLGISAAELQKEMKLTGDFASAAGVIIDRELGKMGDVAKTTGQKLATVTATTENLKTGFGELIISIAGGDGVISTFFNKILKGAAWVLDSLKEINEYGSITSGDVRKQSDDYISNLKKELEGQNRLIKAAKLREEKQVLLNKLSKIDLAKWVKTGIGKEKGVIDFTASVISNLIKSGKATKEQVAEFELLNLELKKINKIQEDPDFWNNDAIKETNEDYKQLDETLDGLGDNVESIDWRNILDLEQLQKDIDEGLAGVFIPDAKSAEVQNVIQEKTAALFKQAEKSIKDESKNLTGRLKSYFGGEGGSFLGAIFGSKEGSEQLASAVRDAADEMIGIIGGILDAQRDANSELIDLADERIAKIQEELDAELEKITKQKDAGQAYDLSKKQDLIKQIAFETTQKEKALQEEKKIKLKQQRLAIISANINIASSILQALGSSPPPYSFIIAAIAAALGAVQLVTIKNQKFAEGSEYVQRNGAPKGTDTIHAMVNEGERIVPTDINSKIPKGFKNWMLPAAAELFMQGGNHVYMNESTEGVGYLKKIEKNTQNNVVRNAAGRVVFEKKGNHYINYN